MGRTTLIVWGAGVMTAALASAQPPRVMTPPAPQTLTLTGCVSRWDVSTMGAAPAAGGGAVPFVLTDAERVVPPASPAANPAPGAGDDAPGRGAHSTYLLRAGAATLRLETFVDQRVEATGVLATDVTAATPAAATPPPRPTPTGESEGAPPAPPVSFTVTAIKTVDKTCPAK
jgi:hypothetical protein